MGETDVLVLCDACGLPCVISDHHAATLPFLEELLGEPVVVHHATCAARLAEQGELF